MKTFKLAAAAPALVLSAVAMAHLAIAATAGDAVTFTVKLTNVTKDDTLKVPGAAATKAPIAPGVFVVSPDSTPIFTPGQPAGRDGLEALAEDGNSDALLKALAAKYGDKAGVLAPGLSFEIAAKPGDRLAIASMFVQSNDKFYGLENGSIALFDEANRPISGIVTDRVMLFDAGTEKDEQPGAGQSQAPRQTAMGQGEAENGLVRAADDGFAYPATGAVVELTITPSN